MHTTATGISVSFTLSSSNRQEDELQYTWTMPVPLDNTERLCNNLQSEAVLRITKLCPARQLRFLYTTTTEM